MDMRDDTTRNEKEEDDEESQAKIDIWKYVFGFVEMAVVKCAIELEIPDTLESHKTPMSLQDLSISLGTHRPTLHRVMRFLTRRGIFKGNPEGYSRTALSRLLMRCGDQSMASLVLFESCPEMLAPFHWLAESLKSPEGHPFLKAHGKDLWAYARARPEHARLIDDAMGCSAREILPALVGECGEVFEGIQSLVDVGGGNGTTLRGLVKAFPWMRGINFDVPHVVAAAQVLEGVRNVGGDFFQSVPKADAALLMWVLHDWGDEECIQILNNCREAIPGKIGKVIILEAVIEENSEDEVNDSSLMMDMLMLFHTQNGKERTLQEWDYLLKESGFGSYTLKRIGSIKALIEAYPMHK